MGLGGRTGMSQKRNSAAFSVTGSESDWLTACQLAAMDDGEFATFRGLPTFKRVVEGTPPVAGKQLLARCSRNPFFWRVISDLQASDEIGGPTDLVVFQARISGESMALSPTTLRYANNVLNMLDCFGEDVFSEGVVEIGGGYGGEAKVIQDFASTLNIPMEEYAIYDLESSYPLIERYLRVFGYNFRKRRLTENSDSQEPIGLVISNGALSEMTSPLIDEYLECVISRARRGYFITNFESHSLPRKHGWSTGMFIDALQAMGKTGVRVQSGSRALSLWDKGKSQLVTFGGNPDRITRPPTLDRIRYFATRALRRLRA